MTLKSKPLPRPLATAASTALRPSRRRRAPLPPGSPESDWPRPTLGQLVQQARAVILSRQDPNTGLLPASTAITVHGDYTHAWVRDNVYSILAIWALSRACRRARPDDAPALEAAVTKLMRGLLAAMMRQAHKVERFKHTKDPLDALHAKYATTTGEPVVGDAQWGHLQIDATAVFLLVLAQMTAGGLRIVQRRDEVDFVQNLVHYLAGAHHTPDYGIWERGDKRNEGRAEVNASSVGMAKAALEAVQGLVLAPGVGPALHVRDDDIALARLTLEALLPRESESKETDAALLSVIGFPAFAVGDAALATRTRDVIVDKLQGRYGCARFLRDGHQTVLEDHGRLHYEPGELARFEHIESEWPLFFTYLLLDALWRGEAAEADDYRSRLEGLMVERDGQRLLPELYWVPAERVEAEKARPHSQPRQPNENIPLVWAQSLYWVGVLVHDGWITTADLNPLGRASPWVGRLGVAQQPVQVALLAEDELVRRRLQALGFEAETAAGVAPLRVHRAEHFEAACTRLGQHHALGLSGRPASRPGPLETAHGYVVGDRRCIVLPSLFDRRGMYLALDNRLLAASLRSEIDYLHRHWRNDRPPVYAWWWTASMLDGPGVDQLLALARELAWNEGMGAHVRVAPLEQIWPHLSKVRLDTVGMLAGALDADPPPVSGDDELLPAWDEASTRVLTVVRLSALESEAASPEGLARLGRQLQRSRNPYEQAELLGLLWEHAGPDAPTPLGASVRALTEVLHRRASRVRLWGVVRRTAGRLELHDESLEDAVAQIVARRLRVALGRGYSADSIVDRPLPAAEILRRVRDYGGADVRGRMLITETVCLLGMLLKADTPGMRGTLTLRPWYLLRLVTARLAREHGVSTAEAFDHLADLSPHAVYLRLRQAVEHEGELSGDVGRQQQLHRRDDATGEGLVVARALPASDPPRGDEPDWAAWREMVGELSRVPTDFYAQVWALLQHTPALVIGDQFDLRNRVDSLLARADSTAGERSFALRIEDLLHKIQAAEYRQLTIEALVALAGFGRANPGLQLDEPLVLDVLVGTAVRLAWRQAHGGDADAPFADQEQVSAAWRAFYLLPPHQVANAVVDAVMHLMQARQAGAPPPASGPVLQPMQAGSAAAAGAQLGAGDTGSAQRQAGTRVAEVSASMSEYRGNSVTKAFQLGDNQVT